MTSAPYQIVTSIDDKQWDEFVINHTQGNIFQTRQMYEVYRQTKNYDPLKFFAINQDTGQLSGVLSAVIVKEIGGPLGNFSAHSIIQGGPLVLPGQEHALIPLLLSEHDRLSHKKALYSETRNMHDVKDNLRGLKNYVYEDHLDYLVKLDQSEESLWHSLHRSKKNHINKAQKLNVEIKDLSDRERLPDFYQLIKETYRNAKIPLAHYSLFESTYDILFSQGMTKFVLAWYQNECIAAQLFLLYKSTIYAWYLGASRNSLNYHPNEYLTWWILKWGIHNGYQAFDFGGGGKPNAKYGPRDYKREFGGEEVNFGRHKNIYKPLSMKVTEAGFGVYRKLVSLNNRFQTSRA